MSLLPEINQASAEINKLVAQANIHQTIAPVYPAAFTDPADTMLLASRDPVIREVSVGMTGEAYSDYTVSGTPPLSLPNSLGKPLKAWSVDVLPKQDLHGYDAPWPAGGGKNKCPDAWVNKAGYWYGKRDDNTRLALSGLIKVIPGETYTISRNSGTIRYAIQEYANTDESSVTNPCINDTKWISSSSYTLTMSATTNYIWVCMSYSNFSRVTPEEGVSAKVQIEAGSTATSFAPYSNVCPILGTDKLNMFVEESYDQSATPKAVITLPQTVYTGTIGSEGGESRSILWTANTSTMNNSEDYPGWSNSGIREILGAGRGDNFNNQRMSIGNQFNINTMGTNDILYLSKTAYNLTQSEWQAMALDVQIEVILPTSTQFPLTSPTIPTPAGTATTWATAEDGTVDGMEVTYVGKA